MTRPGVCTGITRQWPVSDPLGSVVGITNGFSVATQINTYDEYGVPGASFSGRFGYAGSMSLNRAMAAPWFMRNRQYNPTLGRFMQTDPIGIAGGGGGTCMAMWGTIRRIWSIRGGWIKNSSRVRSAPIEVEQLWVRPPPG